MTRSNITAFSYCQTDMVKLCALTFSSWMKPSPHLGSQTPWLQSAGTSWWHSLPPLVVQECTCSVAPLLAYSVKYLWTNTQQQYLTFLRSQDFSNLQSVCKWTHGDVRSTLDNEAMGETVKANGTTLLIQVDLLFWKKMGNSAAGTKTGTHRKTGLIRLFWDWTQTSSALRYGPIFPGVKLWDAYNATYARNYCQIWVMCDW